GASQASRRGLTAAVASVAFFFDRLELGFGGVAFLHHPVEGLVEIVDLRVGGPRDPVAHDVVNLARALALQQLICLFLVQTNHSGSFPSPSRRFRCPCCGLCPSPSARPLRASRSSDRAPSVPRSRGPERESRCLPWCDSELR